MSEPLSLTPNRPEVLDEVFDGEAVLVNGWGGGSALGILGHGAHRRAPGRARAGARRTRARRASLRRASPDLAARYDGDPRTLGIALLALRLTAQP